ncbi:AraC family transcriptional regulator [Pelagicoccus sp. SDUM812005]|uniref:AraC family transcriptional regulator n=1 Tax=Pelagicoccus sp. SDUM812005 TaxID=3041257 RepID=UPI00280F89CC|nr:AraC family transcriptional regulator [Pelagicoccus sp. SDUM812005]MDQ8182033.1 AraC family transcriptional regulator [Pelagicoccus sp. SDUM812005]
MPDRTEPPSLDNQSPRLRDTLARIGIAAPEVIELFDYLEDMPLWMKDAQGTYKWVNVSFLLNFGIKSRAEVIGHNDYDLCSEALANQYRIDDERVLKGERILSRLELIGRFDHTARWCLTSKIPLHDAKGKVVGNVGITRPLDMDGPARHTDYPLSAAVRYISQHYMENITNADLAKACNLSVRAFERQFRANYENTPHSYVRQMRVRMSCSRLVYTKKPIAAIASEFGFADQSHFGKEFRRVMGETPRDYRIRFQG